MDFDNYNLEMKLSGTSHFDIHGGFSLEFNLDSYNSQFGLSHVCTTSYLTNVPVPASNERIWKFVKTSTHFHIYCDGIQVGSLSPSAICLESQWNSYIGRGLYFYSDDSATKYYRIVPSE